MRFVDNKVMRIERERDKHCKNIWLWHGLHRHIHRNGKARDRQKREDSRERLADNEKWPLCDIECIEQQWQDQFLILRVYSNCEPYHSPFTQNTISRLHFFVERTFSRHFLINALFFSSARQFSVHFSTYLIFVLLTVAIVSIFH